MLKSIQNVGGSYKAELTTADFGGISEHLQKKGICLKDIETAGSLTYRFTIHLGDYRTLEKICDRRGDQVKILREQGLPGVFKKLLKRPVLTAGILMLLCLFLILPGRILFVTVSGNHTVPQQKILEAAGESGLSFFCQREHVRSEKIKNELLHRIPELSWAGINTHGCVAEISVREQKVRKDTLPIPNACVTAERDGIITSCTVESGTKLCRRGQAVKKDQILISGQRENGILHGMAEGEVFALTERHMETVAPRDWFRRGEMEKKRKVVTLILGKKRIKIMGSSGNSAPDCGRIYEEYFISLPGGFRLPVILTVDTFESFDMTEEKQSPEGIAEPMKQWADFCLRQKMIAGRIVKRREKYLSDEKLFRIRGHYLCEEMIGRIRTEMIGEKQDTWNES